jgi:hypothetical protein
MRNTNYVWTSALLIWNTPYPRLCQRDLPSVRLTLILFAPFWKSRDSTKTTWPFRNLSSRMNWPILQLIIILLYLIRLWINSNLRCFTWPDNIGIGFIYCIPRPVYMFRHYRVESSLLLLPTVSRPVYHGIRHSSGAYDQIFITVRQLRVCWCGALSLTRGRVCHFKLLLALASAVILGLSPVGLATIFYYPRFETSPFVASYDSQAYGGGIRPRLHTGFRHYRRRRANLDTAHERCSMARPFY